MAFSTTLPLSEILRSKDVKDEAAGDGPGVKTKSREDWRKAKELEEARKVSEIIFLFVFVVALWIMIEVFLIVVDYLNFEFTSRLVQLLLL